MPQDSRNELCESLASKMRGEGGTIEANLAKTCGQEPDEGSWSTTDDNAPTDGCRMVQEAVREFGKKKKVADQSKKAGSTRNDENPGDNRGMMSQDKRGRKGKRSGHTVQRSVPTPHEHREAISRSPAKARLPRPQEALWSSARTCLEAQRITLVPPHLLPIVRTKNARP